MLKVFNREGIRWLTSVCQVVCVFRKTPKGVIISQERTKKLLVKDIRIIEEHHFLAFQEKCMARALKENAEK